MKEIAKKLDGINQTLERQNQIILQMLDIMSRPADKFTSFLEKVVLIAGAFGFITIADTIVKWIKGG